MVDMIRENLKEITLPDGSKKVVKETIAIQHVYVGIRTDKLWNYIEDVDAAVNDDTKRRIVRGTKIAEDNLPYPNVLGLVAIITANDGNLPLSHGVNDGGYCKECRPKVVAECKKKFVNVAAIQALKVIA